VEIQLALFVGFHYNHAVGNLGIWEMTQLTWLAVIITAYMLVNAIKKTIKGEWPQQPKFATQAHIRTAYFVSVVFRLIILCALFQRG